MHELYVTSRNNWRAWLEENHGLEKEVWLIFYKKRSGKPSTSYEDSVEEALCFGWIDSIVKRIDDEKYARKSTPRKPSSRWSESNKKRVNRMIKEGRMTGAGLALIKLAQDTGRWSKRPPVNKRFSVPKYIRDALELNDKASRNFDNLAPSYKRQYVGWVDSAKKEETRRRRLAEAIRLLERNEKLGMK